MRLDCHNHVMPPAVLDLVSGSEIFAVSSDGKTLTSDLHPPIPIVGSFIDPAAKLAELEKNDLDGAVISINPPLFFYTIPEDAATALCITCNTALAEFCAVDSERLHWMAHVPLQAPERAAEVLRQAAVGGCVGVAICTLVGDDRVDAPRFEPFWATAESLRLPVFIHPGERNPAYPGIEDFFLRNVVGNPLETTVTVERLITAGVLDRHPSLRLLLPHAGGYYPYQAGRLGHAQRVRPELLGRTRSPWDYRGQLHADTIAHDDAALRYLVERMGTENVVLGTDLPTSMADPRMWHRLQRVVGRDDAQTVAALNPARLFQLPHGTG